MRAQITAIAVSATLATTLAAGAGHAQTPPAGIYLGEMRAFSFSYCPTGWLPADGRLMQIQSNIALFTLLGSFYGGDGKYTFALPNLQGLTPIGTPVGGYLGQPATASPGATPRFLTMTWCIAVQGAFPPHPSAGGAPSASPQ